METMVDKGIIYVKPFSMKLAGFETDIEGKHDMNGGMNYILRMAIPPFDIVKIPLHVNGTYDKPKIHLGKGHEETFKKITSINHR
jgi:AsmA protein